MSVVLNPGCILKSPRGLAMLGFTLSCLISEDGMALTLCVFKVFKLGLVVVEIVRVEYPTLICVNIELPPTFC